MSAVPIPVSQPAAGPAPFDALAERYDETFTASRIGTAQRDQVWLELDRVFVPGQRVLEINCGTGVDAVHLASRGVQVWACDSSWAMLDVAKRRVDSFRLGAEVHLQLLPTEQIGSLQPGPLFDGAFSNFGGLNCVEDIGAAARKLAALLRPGSPAVLCVMGRYVAWEVLWFMLQGRLNKAVRRLGSQPVRVRLGGQLAACWYRSVRTLCRIFLPYFRLLRWRGIGVSIPPSYLERRASQFPKLMRALERADPYLGRTPLFRGLADHLLLTFERR